MSPVGPLILLVLVWTVGAGAQNPPDMTFVEYLDEHQLVCLSWSFDNTRETITFMLSVGTAGWVGFGFSPNGGMAGADMVIGGLGPDGTYFNDYHATGNTFPKQDIRKSYSLLSLTEVDGQTNMTFQRPIKLCDTEDFDIPDALVKLIYAYGPTDTIDYHEMRRGTKAINLLNHKLNIRVPDAKFFDISVENITVPPLDTYYECRFMHFPQFSKKHHIYRIEPKIDNLDLVHHILIYSCPSSVTTASSRPCYISGMETCFNTVAVWAIGGGVFEFPEKAGLPFGDTRNSIIYRLEIHYNNPSLISGRIDSSGLRMYYTPTLRESDVGILTTGLSVDPTTGYVIPPHAKNFRSYGVCDTSRFAKRLGRPMPDLQVFAVMLHTHLAGRKVKVGHFRNGKQLGYIALNRNYNFDLQETTISGQEQIIKEGDVILVECIYNTADRSRPTTMGLSTNDEMCLAFLYFYPYIDVTVCWSVPHMAQLSPSDIPVAPANGTLSEDDITRYETLVLTIPQIEMVGDIESAYDFGLSNNIKIMNDTPVTCLPKNHAPRYITTSWSLALTGSVLLLLLLTTGL